MCLPKPPALTIKPKRLWRARKGRFMKAAKRTKLWAAPFAGEKRLVVRARQDHNRLWSSRRRLFFWSDLVGLGRTHPGLPRPSLAKAGRAELPLRRLLGEGTTGGALPCLRFHRHWPSAVRLLTIRSPISDLQFRHSPSLPSSLSRPAPPTAGNFFSLQVG